MSLAETQQLFWELMTQKASPARAAELARNTGGLSPNARVQLYANMYLWRQIDVLREDYPKLAALLGDEGFYDLAEAYVYAHPSNHPSLSRRGALLPAFVAQQVLARPDVADLSALEWARAEVFEEENVEPAQPSLLAEIPPEALAEAVLWPIPALRVLTFHHDVGEVWSALEQNRSPPEPARRPSSVAVWRAGFDVFHAPLAEDELLALKRLRAGACLGEVCEAFAFREDPSAAAFEALGSWFHDGWIRGRAR